MVLGQHGIIGDLKNDLDISYLADTVMLLRFFEANGSVLKSIAVVKTRTAEHERTLREFHIATGVGIEIGEPIKAFTGILSGNPVFDRQSGPLLQDGSAGENS